MTEAPEPADEASPIDPALLKETERLEQLALNLESAMPVRSLPRQEYLQATVIPLLLEGMAWIIKERPEDPVENLAMFLIKNNPMTPELHRSLDLSEFE
jgi:hypothetical protein